MTYTIQPIYLSGSLHGYGFYQDLKATSITTTMNNVSEVLQAVDGTNSYLHRSYKHVWNVTFNMIVYSGSAGYPLATVANLRGIYQGFSSVSTSVIFCFESKQYPVFFEPGSWQAELASTTVTMTNKPYYNVSFRLVEI